MASMYREMQSGVALFGLRIDISTLLDEEVECQLISQLNECMKQTITES